MVVDLPATQVCGKRAPLRASLQDCTKLPTLGILPKGRVKAAPEGEWHLTMAFALEHLPSGSRLVVRDASGREWCICPASQPTSQVLRRVA
jgi:hypothetical protein